MGLMQKGMNTLIDTDMDTDTAMDTDTDTAMDTDGYGYGNSYYSDDDSSKEKSIFEK